MSSDTPADAAALPPAEKVKQFPTESEGACSRSLADARWPFGCRIADCSDRRFRLAVESMRGAQREEHS